MPEDHIENPIADYFRLRRRILSLLYAFFQEYPYGSMELRQIREACGTTADLLNWNLVYLEKRGYAELDRSSDCPPYVSCSAVITADGIDLVEDSRRLDTRFPATEY